MKKIYVRNIVCVIIAMMYMLGVTGCSKQATAKSANGSEITANLAKSQVSFTNVNFYDFYNDYLVNNFNKKNLYVLSNSLNSTEVWIADTSCNRVMCVSKKLSSRPSSFVLYTNCNKTQGDTYYVKQEQIL